MDNYYNVFKGNFFSFDSAHQKQAEEVTGLDKDSLINRYSSASNSSGSIQVSISQDAIDKSNGTPIVVNQNNSIPIEPTTYNPMDGVLVKKDYSNFLNDSQKLDKRISMVEASGGESSNPDALGSILSLIEKKDINSSEILKSMDLSSESSDKLSVQARVELGEIRGGDFIFDEEGNIIGQKVTELTSGARSSNTQFEFDLKMDSDNQININISIEDTFKWNGSSGLARNYGLSFSSEQSLDESEIEAVYAFMKEADKLIASFTDDYGITENELSSFQKTILSEMSNSSISSFSSSLTTGTNSQGRTISISGEGGQVDSEVTDINIEDLYKTKNNELEMFKSQKKNLTPSNDIELNAFGAYIKGFFE